MKRLVGIFALGVAAAVLVGPLTAGDSGKKGSKDIDAIFRKLDANKDGRLSKAEFLRIAERFRDKEKARTQLGQTYDKLDPQRQGLTQRQFRTFLQASRQNRDTQAKQP